MHAKPEIGGYFELERGHGTLLHEDALALNCGRSCLRYLIQARDIHEIWLPDHLCYVMNDTCEEMGVTVRFYGITEALEPAWDFDLTAGQWLYLVDYYGQLTDDCVRRAAQTSEGRLIVDETQGYFSQPREGIDTMYSCRKYFGVPDGGFLYTDAHIEEELPIDISYERMSFVLGRLELGSAKFLDAARRNNDELGECGLRRMSELTKSLLRTIDYPHVISIRERNFKALADSLQSKNELSVSCPPGPFAYPLLVEDGPAARAKLAARGVFVPCLWPEIAESAPEESVAHRYARDILPLPVDQRYGEEEMSYIVKCLRDESII